MDIQKTFDAMTEPEMKLIEKLITEYDEKKRHEAYVKREREKFINQKPGTILIKDFVKEIPMSSRLRKALLYERFNVPIFTYLEHVTYMNFLFVRNAGKMTWKELMDIINNLLKETRFEPYEKTIQAHFTEENKKHDWKY